jgi:8-oxo-dGTP pyrophosphatase MutT (NUDIX family)
MTKSNDNPWQTLGSKVMYENPWMKAREDSVRMPSGKQGIYGYIESKPGVFIIALTDDDRIHLIESFRYPTQKWQWELPTGGIEKGMSPLESAQHELAEELGMTAENWTHVNVFGPSSNGFMNDTQNVFVAQGLREDSDATPEESEAIRAKKAVTIEELMTMIKQGVVMDGQSLAALMQFFAWRRKVE